MLESIHITVFIDGYGWEIFKRYPILEEELEYACPVESVFGYSSACDPTIITGLLPAEHGHFSAFYYSPESSPFKSLAALRFLPRGIFDRGRVRHAISKIIARHYGYTGYFQIYNMPFELLPQFDYNEKHDIYRSGGIVGGQENIFEVLEKREIPYFVSDWRMNDSASFREFAVALQNSRPNFAYLILGELDAVLHAEGTRSEKIRSTLSGYERQLRQLLQTANQLYESVTLTIISDHGMTDVIGTIDLRERLKEAKLREGIDYIAVFDATMARFWFPEREQRAPLEDALSHIPQGRVLSEAELCSFGSYFPDNKYGELIFLLQPGWMINPSHMGTTPVRGMHGYDPSHSTSHAVFLRTARPPIDPSRLDDLFKLFLYDCDSQGEDQYAAG
jgi:predicted AlkP superfamily pyrophosphatase or phosphodiesterase